MRSGFARWRRRWDSGVGGRVGGGASIPAAYNTRTSNDNNIDSTSVDMNGNGYSRPNSRSVTSPGILPMPIFLSHGQQDDSTATATKVVKSQRIIVIPQPEAK